MLSLQFGTPNYIVFVAKLSTEMIFACVVKQSVISPIALKQVICSKTMGVVRCGETRMSEKLNGMFTYVDLKITFDDFSISNIQPHEIRQQLKLM